MAATATTDNKLFDVFEGPLLVAPLALNSSFRSPSIMRVAAGAFGFLILILFDGPER